MTLVSHHAVQLADLEVHYLEAGSGPDLILLHGGLATAEMMWGDRIGSLAQNYHVIAPDSRGHGKTRNSGNHLGYDQMADDTARLVDALGIGSPMLVGYSDGAQIALEFAIRHPGRARGMVLGGVVSEPHKAYLKGLTEWGFSVPHADIDAIQQSFGDEFFNQTKRVHGYDGEDWRLFLDQIAKLWVGVPHYGDEQLKAIDTPTLIAVGDRDVIAGLEQAVRLFTLLTKAELAVIPNGDHGVVGSDLFWAPVVDFLQRTAER